MSQLPTSTPIGVYGAEPSEDEINRILRAGRRASKRRKAAREALSLSGAARLFAETELRKTVASAVLQNLPKDRNELVQLLWPHLALYSDTVFDKIAERGLETLKSKFSVRRYRHWLFFTVTSAVVDEDICPAIEGQIDATAEHVLGVIGETVFPQPADHTRRALWQLRNEMFGDPHALNIKTRLKAHLRGGIGRWEAEAIERTSPAGTAATEATATSPLSTVLDTTVRPDAHTEAAMAARAGSGGQAKNALQAAEFQATTWGDVEISFFSEFSVRISVGEKHEVREYGSLGMADDRSGKPTLAWLKLHDLAQADGVIARGTGRTTAWKDVEKRMQELRAWLKERFGLSSDPLPFIKRIGYQAQFKISCARSYQQ